MKSILNIGLFLFVHFIFGVVSQTVNPAPTCDATARENCQLPNCRCSGTDIPGNLAVTNIPQLVFLTFDDAVVRTNYPFYKDIFSPKRVNPNGERITGTFYVTHEYSDYSMVHDLWADGHEIALHSMTHYPYVTYWKNMNESSWIKEVIGQRETMHLLGKIPLSDIKGFRTPFLQGGGDTMYKVLNDHNFQYECSRPTEAYRKPGLWPYTNNYQSIQDCPVPPCAKGAYNGFWTVPMVEYIGDNGQGCAMADYCTPVPQTQKDMYSLLSRNFLDHYKENKAPFGIYIHSGWVNGSQDGNEVDERRASFEQFIDNILALGDVYIVSVTKGIEWIKNPQNLQQTKNFSHFKVDLKTNLCRKGNSCHYPPSKTPFPSERYMVSCVTCPVTYPWLGNPKGL